MNLGVIVLYAPREYACEITGEVVGLYRQIVDDLDYIWNMPCIRLFPVWLMHFDDEYERMISMIDEKTSKTTRFQLVMFKDMLEKLDCAYEKIAKLENSTIPELEARIKSLEMQLNSK